MRLEFLRKNHHTSSLDEITTRTQKQTQPTQTHKQTQPIQRETRNLERNKGKRNLQRLNLRCRHRWVQSEPKGLGQRDQVRGDLGQESRSQGFLVMEILVSSLSFFKLSLPFSSFEDNYLNSISNSISPPLSLGVALPFKEDESISLGFVQGQNSSPRLEFYAYMNKISTSTAVQY